MQHKLIDFLQLNQSRLIDEASKTLVDNIGNSESGNILEVKTIATHSGKEINDRIYPGVHVKAGARTFFKNDSEGGAKFDKPFMKNHNTYSSDPIGRVVDAVYSATLSGSRWTNDFLEPTEEGSGFITTTAHIPDPDSIVKFLDKRFTTVSIGASTDGVFCVKCTKEKGEPVPLFSSFTKNAKDNVEQSCSHYPGDIEDGVKNLLFTGAMTYDEMSQVPTPADDGGVHIGMEMLKDHLNDSQSVISLMGKKFNKIEVLDSSMQVSILDAKGNPFKSLNIEDYVPTKLISVPSRDTAMPQPTKIEDNKDKARQGDTSKSLSASVFADARLLKHFSIYKGLELNDSEIELVDSLKTVDLTDNQKAALESGFYLSDELPFSLLDSETGQAAYKLAYRVFGDESQRSSFLSSIKDQAEEEKLTINLKGIDVMDEKQAKVLMDALEAGKVTIAKLTKDLEDSNKQNETLKADLAKGEVASLIDMRAEVGYLDCKDFDKKSEEDKKVLVDSYAKLSSDVRTQMVNDAKESIEAGIKLSTSLADTKELSPLEPEDKTKIAGGGTKVPEIKDNKPVAHVTDLI